MTYPRIVHDDWFDDPPRPEEEVAAVFDWEDTAPSEYEPPEEEITMHEKMYRLAIEKHNPWGSEGFHTGGSEQCQQ